MIDGIPKIIGNLAPQTERRKVLDDAKEKASDHKARRYERKLYELPRLSQRNEVIIDFFIEHGKEHPDECGEKRQYTGTDEVIGSDAFTAEFQDIRFCKGF